MIARKDTRRKGNHNKNSKKKKKSCIKKTKTSLNVITD